MRPPVFGWAIGASRTPSGIDGECNGGSLSLNGRIDLKELELREIKESSLIEMTSQRKIFVSVGPC